jgi:SnoaL-like domain
MNIQALHDKQEITELMALYAAAIDRRDGRLLERVFTADAKLHYGVMDMTVETLIGMLRSDAQPFLMTHHHVGNVLVQFEDADRATVVSYVSATHRARERNRFRDEMIRARYLDRVVRQDGRWRIQDRLLIYDWSHVFAGDDTNWWDHGGDAVVTGAPAPHDITSKFLEHYGR